MPENILVIDVSNNTPNVDFAGLKRQGVRSVYAKSSEGTGFTDGVYERFRSQARAAGLLFGAYHFAHVGVNTPEAEADFFLAAARPTAGDLIPMFDVEYPSSAAAVDAWTLRAITRLEQGLRARKLAGTAGGQAVGVYTGRWYWDSRTSGRSMGVVPLWLAAYQSADPGVARGWSHRVGWQFNDAFDGRSQDISRFSALLTLGPVPVPGSKKKKAAAAGAAAAVAAGGAGGAAATNTHSGTAKKPVPVVSSSPHPSPTKATPVAGAKPTTKPSPTSTALPQHSAAYTASVTLRKVQGSYLHVKVTGHDSKATDVAYARLIGGKHSGSRSHIINEIRDALHLKRTGGNGPDLHGAWGKLLKSAGPTPKGH